MGVTAGPRVFPTSGIYLTQECDLGRSSSHRRAEWSLGGDAEPPVPSACLQTPPRSLWASLSPTASHTHAGEKMDR